MGANQSNLTGQSIDNQLNESISAKLSFRHGFQILRVHPNSPVSEAHVHPYFDYIIAINGVEVSPDIPNIISDMAKNHVNKPLKLNIYNSREDEERQVTIVPRTGWGGDGLLGCAIRFSPMDGVRDRAWHILKVHSNSPAEKAGLIETEDYVIASPDILLRSEDEFYQLITQNTRRQVKLIIFNSRTNQLREIEIIPDFEWGGEGCLGCDVGSGMVHWIPKSVKQTPENNSNMERSNSLNQNPSLLGPAAKFPPWPQPSQSLLQAQYDNPTLNSAQPPLSSLQESPPKDPIVVSVNVPSARPVINNLSGGISGTSNFNTTSSQMPGSNQMAPPPLSKFHHQPHSAQTTASQQQIPHNGAQDIDDDIPLPNFTVPSEIIHQK